MSREVPIPLVLWISTATLVHAMGGGGAVEAARTISDRASVRSMVNELRQDLAPAEGTIEVMTDGAQLTPRSEPNPAENPSAKPLDPPKDPPKPEDKKEPPKKPPPKPVVLKKVEPKPPPPEPPKPKPPEPPKPKIEEKKPPPPPLVPLAPQPKKEEKKPPPPPPPVAKKEDPPEKKAPPPPPPPPPDRRIAVVQDSPKDEPDNPTATRVAERAHTTKEETVARVRAYDGTASAKLEGGRMGEAADKGDSDKDEKGQSEDRNGNKDHAPGENNPKAVASAHVNPAPPAPPAPAGAATHAGPPLSVPGNTGGGGKQIALSPASNQPPAAASPGGAGPASPEAHTAAAGGWSLDPANPGGDGSSRVAGVKRDAGFQNPVRVQSMGFGAPGLPGGLNINLTMTGLEAAVGQDKLKAERAADGEARRAKHRGANGEKDKFDWRAAVENYEPSVKTGNQTSLNTAASPFATYLNTMHNRIHPIFADEFLNSLSNLPPGHTLNANLVTFVEIVLGKDDGKIVRTGITKASGSTVFDLIAVNAARRAGPFGKPPDSVVSYDGKVYVHWEFHRDPYDACSSRNARPYILKAPEAKTDTTAQPTPKPAEAPKPPDEHSEPPSTKGPVPLPSDRF